MGHWALGPVGIFVNGMIGLWIVNLFVRLSARADNFLTHTLEAVGRRSLNIFCVHTIELIAVPWYLFAAQFVSSPLLGLGAQYVLRCSFVALICLLLELRKRFVPGRTKKARLERSRARFQRYVARH